VHTPNSVADKLINHFLYNTNYRYSSIYPPTFAAEYSKWWEDRANGRQLSPEFTCLLLRVCAYSSQYLPDSLREQLQFELGANVQILTERFNRSADQLSQTFHPEKPSLTKVQQLFLRGAWLKSESMLVQSWHTLGTAVREAQELGE
jgi:hypothetical protein